MKTLKRRLFLCPNTKSGLYALVFVNLHVLLGIRFIALFLLFSVCSCVHFKPPRCRTQGCEIRMIHGHKGKEYRGRPWWRRNQNPKVGQEYKQGKVNE